MNKNPQQENHSYMPHLTRRESLKWLGMLTAAVAAPQLVACAAEKTVTEHGGHWPSLKLTPITANGYGKDPDLLIPPRSAWPRTLTAHQLNQVARLSDILIPEDESYPAATQVGVPEVVDEWVSAPYEGQQKDRERILNLLQWLDDESQLRYKTDFLQLDTNQQLSIIDDIAYDENSANQAFAPAIAAFSRFRRLVLAAFFCSPEGTKVLGYMGNTPIAGDYPGPTPEATNHINVALEQLGLSQYAWQD